MFEIHNTTHVSGKYKFATAIVFRKTSLSRDVGCLTNLCDVGLRVPKVIAADAIYLLSFCISMAGSCLSNCVGAYCTSFGCFFEVRYLKSRHSVGNATILLRAICC